jgi:hypothetical protein
MMWAKLQKTGGALLLLQGAGHTLLGTFVSYNAVTQEAVWFASAGLAMCFLGLLNIGPWETAPAWFRRCTIMANGLWLALMVALFATSQSGRVVAALAFVGVCLVGSTGRWRGSQRKSEVRY